jgi:serine/threonine-protein kinase/endoribonuclease IRE1
MAWQPSEVLNGSKRTKAMDIFSLGCVFYYILTCGEHPFAIKGGNRQTTLTNILQNKFSLEKLSGFPEAIELVGRMIHFDYEKRPPMREILSHIMFWSHDKKLRLIMDLSDHLEFLNASHPTVRGVEKLGRELKMLDKCQYDWS